MMSFSAVGFMPFSLSHAHSQCCCQEAHQSEVAIFTLVNDEKHHSIQGCSLRANNLLLFSRDKHLKSETFKLMIDYLMFHISL